MDKKKKPNYIRIIYATMAIILVAIAGIFIILKLNNRLEGVSTEQLLAEALSKERYVTSDEISDRIINQDPSLKLVDVRDEESFENYSLPQSMNIPLPELCKEENEEILNQEKFDVVFYSDDHLKADQAWILCNRMGFKNLYVMEGGINGWYESIINPKMPSEDMPEKDFVAYSTRKAASMFYGVAYPDLEQFKKAPVVKKAPPKKVVTVKKKKKKKPEGGC